MVIILLNICKIHHCKSVKCQKENVKKCSLLSPRAQRETKIDASPIYSKVTTITSGNELALNWKWSVSVYATTQLEIRPHIGPTERGNSW